MIRLAVTMTLLLASPVTAAVFEVGDDGTMVRLDSPAAVALPARARQTGTAVAVRARAFRPDVARAGRQYDVSPALIDAIARVESGYDSRAVSRTNAAGIMQLMPGTARAMGVKRADPAANIGGGTAYLRLLLNRFDGDVVRTIAAYNAGPAAVIRAGGIPRFPETVAYVASVMDQLAAAAQ
jgi:soluble lytic murein transglycosylase-like protein